MRGATSGAPRFCFSASSGSHRFRVSDWSCQDYSLRSGWRASTFARATKP